MRKQISVEEVISSHKASGKFFEVDGLNCFALDQGTGEAVFCLHGVPTSSFIYRKVLPELVKKGFRAVAIDLPGFGFSDRPEDFDYSFLSLARFSAAAAISLGLKKYHLLVHDVG